MDNTMESTISIQLVHGGFIFTAQSEDGMYKTEVFTSQAKLMKALRACIEANSLVRKTGEKTDSQGESE